MWPFREWLLQMQELFFVCIKHSVGCVSDHGQAVIFLYDICISFSNKTFFFGGSGNGKFTSDYDPGELAEYLHNSEFFIFFIYIKVSNRSYSLFISDINVGNYNVTEHPGLCLKYIKMPVFQLHCRAQLICPSNSLHNLIQIKSNHYHTCMVVWL